MIDFYMQNVEVYRSKLGKKLDNSLLYVANIKGKVEALWFLYDINNLKENTDKVKIDVKEICVVTDNTTYAYKSIPVNLSFIEDLGPYPLLELNEQRIYIGVVEELYERYNEEDMYKLLKMSDFPYMLPVYKAVEGYLNQN